MSQAELTEKERTLLEAFDNDSQTIGEQTAEFLRLVYPSYLVKRDEIDGLLESDSSQQLLKMKFFRIASCTADNVEKVFQSVNEQFEKLLTALYSVNISIAYGIVSCDGFTNLVIGVYHAEDVECVTTIMQGMLSGVELEAIEPDFENKNPDKLQYGILTGVPSLFVKGQKQSFSLSSIMRSLNGQDYTLLFIAKPVKREIIAQNLSELISVRDKAFAVSKRNVARSSGYSETEAQSHNVNDGKNSVAGPIGSGIGSIIGSVAGTVIGSIVLPGMGTLIGSGIGGSVGGGLGTVIGNLVGQGKTHSEGYSQAITKAISDGMTVSGDIQNGFALELMSYADNAIERLKGGQNSGIWQTAITYSAEKEISRNIICACLCGELSKCDAEKLPMLAFEPVDPKGNTLCIPEFLDCGGQNQLCTYVNSAELGLMCTVPIESVPNFELRLEKKYPMQASRLHESCVRVGDVVDGRRPLPNMPFALSEGDLNKHVLVCGITGSGKTTTVKKIIFEAKKPFLVIEPAKKEYRNIALPDVEVYTFGKPEINAPRINPFYIMPGVSPQTHIDYLKDLFNASFAFYGPMPYILEKCLHTVYRNKGWDLTLGYHPMLANCKSVTDFFDIQKIKKQYSRESHKYLFPTMQDLKNEIARYIDEDLKYDGEVAGNVKTAMKVRLENLCIGAKGYTFNTHEYLDFSKLLERNVVFELEGLADDSDKAFGVGLLVIFINEYRQVRKEANGANKMKLEHLLVIEEAHRLLKNIDTERSTESVGNPRGKAVDHFTNMIAEMRSYGQGVIVAEQIPTKLAPDVIKNSSTKIVHRVVSMDDQQAVANTIGMAMEDAIQIGSLESGYAYCHKEGMFVPSLVKIENTFLDSDQKKQFFDGFISDEMLYNKNTDLFQEIDFMNICACLNADVSVKRRALAILNMLMIESEDNCVEAIELSMQGFVKQIKSGNVKLLGTNGNEIYKAVSRCITNMILSLMVNGVYSAKALPEDGVITLLENILYGPSGDDIRKMKDALRKLYRANIETYARNNVVALVLRSLKKNTDIGGTVREYFINASELTVCEIVEKVRGGRAVC